MRRAVRDDGEGRASRQAAGDAAIVAGLLGAYRAGVFPMVDPATGEIEWLSPDPRAVVPLVMEGEAGRRRGGGAGGGGVGRGGSGAARGVHFSRSLRQRVRSGRFVVTTDLAFEAVISACAAEREYASESWIDGRIVRAYTLLHRAGHAHSVEAWRACDGEAERAGGRQDERGATEGDGAILVREIDGAWCELVGGLYGVHIGAAFCGESMFSRPRRGGTDASKVCFVHLWLHLRARGFALLDTQFSNPHMERFGVQEISRAAYLRRLKGAMARRVGWGPWEPAWRGV